MRPTKGEISCTWPAPQATAWQNENSSVRLGGCLAAPAARAAWMPSQVEATLISTRSLCDALGLVQRDDALARAPRVAAVSKLRRASTSVDTRPGHDLQDLGAEAHQQPGR